MVIYFGLELDNLVIPKDNQTQGGVQYFGPQRVLTMLESHLGLIGHPNNNQYLRIEQYRQALLRHTEQAMETQGEVTAFYASSFLADQFATATELLARRDELLLADWDFEVSDNAPHRLQVLAEIEALFSTKKPEASTTSSSNKQSDQLSLNLDNEEQTAVSLELSPGYADRFMMVLNKLNTRKHAIKQIYLNEPFDKLPCHFQQLFTSLKEQGVQILQLKHQGINTSTDLSHLQQSLRKELPRQQKFKAQADGSLFIIQAKRETDAASYLAKFFRHNETYRPVCLVPEKSRSLDNALIQEGLPSMGILSASLARPTLQILKLVTVFLWRPIDPFKIMEFVSLAVKPLADDLANKIAVQMAKTPGLNGEGWYAMVKGYFEELEEKALEDKNIKVSNIRYQYDFWFERKRYDIAQTVPKMDAIEIFDYLARWAFQTFDDNGAKNNSLLVLSEQAKRIKELLETLPETYLTNLELERVVRTIYEPAPVVFQEKELGFLPHVHHTSAIIDQVDDLLWWNFIQNEPAHFFSRWYKKERTYLEDLGVQLILPENENALLIWQRKRPILHTQKRLILVVPQMVEGETAHPHTLSGDIEALFEDLDVLTFNIDTEKGKASFEQFFQLPSQVEIQQRQLGKPRAFLDLDAIKSLSQGEEESFSSLQALFYYPYQWIFKHKIKLIKSSILSVVKDATLMGNLSHRFFEKMFKNKVETWSQQQVEAWIDKESKTLLAKEGAVLLMYGREPERIAFLNRLKYASWSLVSDIQKNGWTVKASESDLKGKFLDIKMKGVADLVLEKGDELAVIDLKWRGARRRQNMIKSQEDLQLVMYSKLLTEDNNWAHTSYFIIEKGEMVARNNLAFKDINAVMPGSDHIAINEDIYSKMEATFRWRMAQLQRGKLEIRCEQTKGDLEDAYAGQMMDLLEMKETDAPFDDYRTLINLIE